MTNRTRIQVKPINMERLRPTKSELLVTFLHSAQQFHYRDEVVNRRAFDLMWQRTSTENGDIECLIVHLF